MRIIEKDTSNFQSFTWLDFDYLPDSQGYKFELYPQSEVAIPQMMEIFSSLFKEHFEEILISTLHPDWVWRDFCLKHIKGNEETDFPVEIVIDPASKYQVILNESKIQPNFSGFCKCRDWGAFLPIILDCIFQQKALYSLMFYIPSIDLVFYFHYSHSLGIYYKELTDGVLKIIQTSKESHLEICNSNDERVKQLK